MVVRLRVIVDERERQSGVPDLLRSLGVLVDYRMLEVGDYLVPGYAVERKEMRDFVRSVYSGRIFDQAYRLGETYERPILMVEGDPASILGGTMKPEAYWGALTSLTYEYGLTVFFTPNKRETANLIYTLARRERATRRKAPIIRRKPKMIDLTKMQIFQVSSLPGIGPKLAERILRRFGTVRGVFNASIPELSTVKGVGRAKAERIVRFLTAPYSPAAAKPRQLRLDEHDPKSLNE